MQLPTEAVLSDEATQEEIDTYVTFWRSRAEKVTKIMGWVGCYGFDPGFSFDTGHSTTTLPLDVVDKLIELSGEA